MADSAGRLFRLFGVLIAGDGKRPGHVLWPKWDLALLKRYLSWLIFGDLELKFQIIFIFSALTPAFTKHSSPRLSENVFANNFPMIIYEFIHVSAISVRFLCRRW
jgi:hypothetical protein